MVFRLLRETDAEAYRDVRLRALQEAPEAFGSSYEEETQWTVAQFAEKLAVTPERWMLGAFDGKGKLVGVIGWYRGARLKIRHKSHIVAVYVEPEHRGKGIAKQLLSQVIDRVRTETDVEQIQLTVAADSAAHALYRSKGFAEFGREQQGLKVGEGYVDLCHMVLHIEK
ncbi:GNAT family N-acetyltransferase [Laceyella sacchari]|nr:GNAT family N-acetyltransferase [Laceyella sacchari]